MPASVVESALLLFLVVDPFGNLPFVLSVLEAMPGPRFRRIVLRETLLAFAVLAAFALGGQRILGYLEVAPASLAVAGGVILFLISLSMVFRSARAIFDDSYGEDPLLVPIAVPFLAGPSAVTVVMILGSRGASPPAVLLLSLVLVFAATFAVLLLGRRISAYLGQRGLRALEKLMGLLLNLVAVNMILEGIRDFMAG